MLFRVFCGVVAVALLLVFISPVVWKPKDLALTIVVLIGITMMLIDAWQSRKTRDH